MASQVAATPVPEPTDKFVTLNGIKLHYADWGGDPSQGTTVLIHGGSANLHWWDLTAPLLTGEGRVLALDFRGHGHSQWASAADYGPAGYIEDVEAFIKHLGVRVVLVGHSMGGAVVLWIAALHPELLEALIIVDSRGGPPPFWRKWQWQWQQRAKPRPRPELASADDIIRRFRLHPEGTYLTREGLAELGIKSAVQLPNGRWAFCFDPQTRQWRERASVSLPSVRQVKTPTLVLRGAQSTLLSPRRSRWMHRKIKGSVLKEIPRAYHHVPLDNPDSTAAAMVDFIRALRSNASLENRRLSSSL